MQSRSKFAQCFAEEIEEFFAIGCFFLVLFGKNVLVSVFLSFYQVCIEACNHFIELYYRDLVNTIFVRTFLQQLFSRGYLSTYFVLQF